MHHRHHRHRRRMAKTPWFSNRSGHPKCGRTGAPGLVTQSSDRSEVQFRGAITIISFSSLVLNSLHLLAVFLPACPMNPTLTVLLNLQEEAVEQTARTPRMG
jgi:hypothetical protein